MSLIPSSNGAPPWQVLVLVANHLDPKTLAMASCVCKSWFLSMSSDHLWKPICSAHFPSLSNLRAASPAVPYRRLYSLGLISDKRRLQKPLKPRLSLDNLIFAIDIHNNDSCILTVAKPGSELDPNPNGVFRFDIEVPDKNFFAVDALDNLTLTWNVVLEGFEGVFTMMDCKGKVRFVPGTDGWFSEELPSPGCCSSVTTTNGLVSDMRLGLRGREDGDGKMTVEKVGVGVLSIVSWRYINVDDALRYLQHFLLPP